MTDPAAESIETLRRSIDRIDAALVELLAERYAITERIGRIKSRDGVAVRDEGRERSMLDRLGRRADEAGLARPILQRLFAVIVDESRRRHEEIRGGGDGGATAPR